MVLLCHGTTINVMPMSVSALAAKDLPSPANVEMVDLGAQ
jgi:hypothetical protein